MYNISSYFIIARWNGTYNKGDGKNGLIRNIYGRKLLCKKILTVTIVTLIISKCIHVS